jgi:prophage maintenance system killer protein
LEKTGGKFLLNLGNKHGFLDGNKRIAFTATDVFK